ncbi:class I SAM-dependent methyltransferase [Plastoroseomonas arctica]|uniref:Class I SAM-dependent methyltransferase n=1 Tax=Plastoroseomonas arctica TaxID=1509237 RepID=A0AAF1JXA3_9PROT|nr:class I SAM-dependent methyltransferase [Plastoroseomonas arctica]MBR0655981.1 class I SAM-dependent methyltransferase [Plastoroseomonas arctica]
MLPDLAGDPYRTVLARLHAALKPKTYFEIGTLGGATLGLAKCSSVAVDPRFGIKDTGVILNKPTCLLFQQTSDDFFAANKLTDLFGANVDFAFLDGMHKCEFLLRDFINTERQSHKNTMIVLHDCIPTEIPMTGRDGIDGKAEAPHRRGWWTGDVWRTLWALMQFRPDLSITALDAKPTGLILITNLHPTSTRLSNQYPEIEKAMLEATLSDIGIENWQALIKVESTGNYASDDQILAKFAFDRH